MALVTEGKLCKMKEVERRDNIAHFFFEGGLKIPNAALRKVGEGERILKNTQNVLRSSYRDLLEYFCPLLDPIGFYLTNCSSYLYQIRFSTLPFSSRGERDQEAKNICYSTGRKGQVSYSLLLPRS